MGNGIPIGAIFTTNKVAATMRWSYGSTYGGNPLACSVSYEVFKEVSKSFNSIKRKTFFKLIK